MLALAKVASLLPPGLEMNPMFVATFINCGSTTVRRTLKNLVLFFFKKGLQKKKKKKVTLVWCHVFLMR